VGIQADVHGRVKSISSIYNKINRRGKTFDEILDLLAIRIIVQQKSDCYRVLGLLHDLYTPVTEHFSDYIALPKSNYYQSLHTKVRDGLNRIIEVQIRTEEMHAIAENGIAAHWKYKEGQLGQDELEAHFQWIRTLMETHQEEAESGEFMESLKVDLFQDEIFVFTPKGTLIQLPKGSTSIDFAFAIHSDVGLHAIGAKVGGRVVPLSHQLESGSTVEILTSPKQNPSAEWLKSVRTARARSRIKRWFRETRWEQAKLLGEEIIDGELERLKLQRNDIELAEVAVSFGYVELSDFFAALGSGVLTLGQVMRKLVPRVAPDRETLLGRIVRKVSKGGHGVKVRGFDNLVIYFADCCNPLPGDPIIGFQQTGKGVGIHRTDCRRVAELLDDEKKVVSVAWDVEREDRFSARIHLVADDRPNLLHDITQAMTSLKINITAIELHMEDQLAVGHMVVEVRNLIHLTKLISKINQIRGVLNAEREDIEPNGNVQPDEAAA
jgi:GTP pyrophosphokinase